MGKYALMQNHGRLGLLLCSCAVALLGGNWNNSTNAGPWYWNVNNTPSNRNRNIGGHPVYAKLIER